MKLLLDVDLESLVPSLGNRASLKILELKRQPTRDIVLQFLSGPFATEIDPAGGPAATIEISANLADDFAGSPLLYTGAFAKTGTGVSALYTANLLFDTVSLRRKFIDGTIAAEAANQAARYALAGRANGDIVHQQDDDSYWLLTDVAHIGTSGAWSSAVPEHEQVDLAGEIKWTVGASSDATFTFTWRIHNNYIRGLGAPPVVTPMPSGYLWLPTVTGLTGGGATKLDAVDTLRLPVNTRADLVQTGHGLRSFWLQTGAADPAAGEVAPLDYDAATNNKKWVIIL